MKLCPIALLWGLAGSLAAQSPVLTDEFDRIVVTAATEPGAVVGRIRLVFPSDKPVRWSLIKPVPGGDRRGYLDRAYYEGGHRRQEGREEGFRALDHRQSRCLLQRLQD